MAKRNQENPKELKQQLKILTVNISYDNHDRIKTVAEENFESGKSHFCNLSGATSELLTLGFHTYRLLHTTVVTEGKIADEIMKIANELVFQEKIQERNPL